MLIEASGSLCIADPAKYTSEYTKGWLIVITTMTAASCQFRAVSVTADAVTITGKLATNDRNIEVHGNGDVISCSDCSESGVDPAGG